MGGATKSSTCLRVILAPTRAFESRSSECHAPSVFCLAGRSTFEPCLKMTCFLSPARPFDLSRIIRPLPVAPRYGIAASIRDLAAVRASAAKTGLARMSACTVAPSIRNISWRASRAGDLTPASTAST